MVETIIPIPVKLMMPVPVVRKVIRSSTADRLDRNAARVAGAHVRSRLRGRAGGHTRDHKSAAQCNG